MNAMKWCRPTWLSSQKRHQNLAKKFQPPVEYSLSRVGIVEIIQLYLSGLYSSIFQNLQRELKKLHEGRPGENNNLPRKLDQIGVSDAVPTTAEHLV